MESYARIRAAQRTLAAAMVVLAVGMGLFSWTRAWSQGGGDGGVLVCTGMLVQSANLTWPKPSIEFSLAYGPGAVSPLKSDIEALNAPMRIEMDEAFLKAAEARPRMPADGSVLRITGLQVSRQTGRFSMQAALTRETTELTVGTASWEGMCNPSSAAPRKF